MQGAACVTQGKLFTPLSLYFSICKFGPTLISGWLRLCRGVASMACLRRRRLLTLGPLTQLSLSTSPSAGLWEGKRFRRKPAPGPHASDCPYGCGQVLVLGFCTCDQAKLRGLNQVMSLRDVNGEGSGCLFSLSSANGQPPSSLGGFSTHLC